MTRPAGWVAIVDRGRPLLRRLFGPLIRRVRAAKHDRLRARRDAKAGVVKVPIVLLSSAKDSRQTGDHRYNGGVKVYNLWCKLLRAHGYPAYVVTWDGSHERWLMDHQPVISLATVRRWRKAGLDLRFVTGWADAAAFIRQARALYFYDCEIAYTSGRHFPLLERLVGSKLKRVGANSRVQQAWHQAMFHRPATFIPEWSDERFWQPDPDRREPGLIGYMDEGDHTEPTIERLATLCRAAQVEAKFERIAGDEAQVIAAMQRADLFLGLNRGKHPMWGEGCPRSQQEALHAGCVVVAYDVTGNREYLIDGFSGFLVPVDRTELMAERVIGLLGDAELKERIRAQSTALVATAFTSVGRWPLVRDMLDLVDLPPAVPALDPTAINKSQLRTLLGDEPYIAEEEIPALMRYAAKASCLVEIGSAFGASAFLMLAAMSEHAELTSIDPFVADSQGQFVASARRCRRNVQAALQSIRRVRQLRNWTLLLQPSYEVAPAFDRSIDLLLIDGDHAYTAVRRDFADWLGHVADGGIILLHDSRRLPDAARGEFARGWDGPTQLASELRSSHQVELVDEVFSMTVWRKRLPSDPSGHSAK